MQVRMQRQILAPGMKNAEEADLCAEMFRIGGDLQHRFRAGPEQQVVNQFGVPVTQRIQFMRQREDHMEVRHAEQFFLSRGEPALTRLRLALRTVPVTAGVIGDGPMAASRTVIDMAAQRGRAATLDGAQHFQLLIAQPGSIPFDEALALRVE